MDQWVDTYVTFAVVTQRQVESRRIKDSLYLVVANAIYYNPVLALQAMQRNNILEEAFNTWSAFLTQRKENGRRNHFRREADKKVNGLALVSLLRLDPQAIPPILQSNMANLFSMCASLLYDLKEQADQREAMQVSVHRTFAHKSPCYQAKRKLKLDSDYYYYFFSFK